jgi:transcriptional regulator with XRE-family HTH domain
MAKPDFGRIKRDRHAGGGVSANAGSTARIPFMSRPTPTRRRSTETVRQAERLSTSIAISLGQTVRAARRPLRVTQRVLAARTGVDQTRISQIERGLGRGVPLELWVALGVALGRPLAISFSTPLAQLRGPVDAGHLAMQERLLRLARSTRRTAIVELASRPADPRHSIDVCTRDDRHRVLILQEAWNTFGDVGAAIRSTNRKAAEAQGLAATIDDGPPYRIGTVWVVRPSAANRALIARYPAIFASAFPGPSRAWAAALTNGTSPPDRSGLVWLDPNSGRMFEWRHPHGSTLEHQPSYS